MYHFRAQNDEEMATENDWVKIGHDYRPSDDLQFAKVLESNRPATFNSGNTFLLHR